MKRRRDFPLLEYDADAIPVRRLLEIKAKSLSGELYKLGDLSDKEIEFARSCVEKLKKKEQFNDLLKRIRKREPGAAEQYAEMVRAARRAKIAESDGDEDDYRPIGIDLRNAEKERYEEIRRYREQYGAPKFFCTRSGRQERKER